MRGARGAHREVYWAEARSEAALDGDDPQDTWPDEELDRRALPEEEPGRGSWREQRVLGAGRVAGGARRAAVVLGVLAGLAIVATIERASRSSAPPPAPVAPGSLPRSHTGSPHVFSLRAGAAHRPAPVRVARRTSFSPRSAHLPRPATATVPSPVPARVGNVAASPALSEFGFER